MKGIPCLHPEDPFASMKDCLLRFPAARILDKNLIKLRIWKLCNRAFVPRRRKNIDRTKASCYNNFNFFKENELMNSMALKLNNWWWWNFTGRIFRR